MILMVEDEPWRNDSYLQELEFAGYQVCFERSVDSAWQRFVEQRGQIDAAILDVMMAPGKRYADNQDAVGGLRTGLVLFRDMRELVPLLPVIFLTNIHFDLIADELRGKNKVLVLRKMDYLPQAVPEQLHEMLANEPAL